MYLNISSLEKGQNKGSVNKKKKGLTRKNLHMRLELSTYRELERIKSKYLT